MPTESMQFPLSRKTAALALGPLTLSALLLGFGPTHTALAQENGPAPTEARPATPATVENYAHRVKELQDQGDWLAVVAVAREWKKALADANSPELVAAFAEADALYKLGDIDGAIALFEPLVKLDPAARPTSGGTSVSPADKLAIARDIRRYYPNLKLQPLKFQPSEAALEATEWEQKGEALLAAKNYDEIEKVAASLQKPKAADVMGEPYLLSFFHGLLQNKEGQGALRSRIAAWRAARPKSNLARLASIQLWTNAAAKARGGGFASTITPAMSAEMDAALQRGSQTVQDLPRTAFSSPLSFTVVMRWGRLAGAPREFFDDLFAQGTAKFPDYLPLYSTQAYNLLPRWFGEAGEAEALLKTRADKIGGADGDIFYGMMVWDLATTTGQLSLDSHFDYARAHRGLKLLHERFPDSVSALSARLGLAFLQVDTKIMQPILREGNGYVLDNTRVPWSTPVDRNLFADFRMGALGEQPVP